jgi:hypothetical protein
MINKKASHRTTNKQFMSLIIPQYAEVLPNIEAKRII